MDDKYKALILLLIAIIIGVLTFVVGMVLTLPLTGYTIQMVPLCIGAYVCHKYMGKYPEPLQKRENPNHDFKIVMILYVILIIYIAIWNYIFFTYFSDSTDFQTILSVILTRWVPLSAVSFLYLYKVDKWDFKLIQFNLKVRNQPSVYIVPYIFLGITVALTLLSPIGHNADPWYLVLELVGVALWEETWFRGVIQNKLEQAKGTEKAVFIGGILFGLFHIPIRVLAPEVMGIPAGDYLQIALSIVTTTAWGWMVGIMYAKTRSIGMPMIYHYLNNHLIEIIGLLALNNI